MIKRVNINKAHNTKSKHMRLFKFFRNKKKPATRVVLPDRPFLEMPELVVYPGLLAPQEKREWSERQLKKYAEEIKEYVEKLNRADHAYYQTCKELTDDLIIEALSKTDDDDTTNT